MDRIPGLYFTFFSLFWFLEWLMDIADFSQSVNQLYMALLSYCLEHICAFCDFQMDEPYSSQSAFCLYINNSPIQMFNLFLYIVVSFSSLLLAVDFRKFKLSLLNLKILINSNINYSLWYDWIFVVVFLTAAVVELRTVALYVAMRRLGGQAPFSGWDQLWD